MPAALAFEPELVLVSAGFDAHVQDPLASCCLETGSFVEMGARAYELARVAGVPLGVVLEGGYNRGVLAECVCATMPALAGEAPASVAPQPPAKAGSPTARAAALLGRYWPV
jgi:acetoin utilization deacetylase AcuC-like enzyme